MPTETTQPGQSPLCRRCRFRLADLADQGHPTPCSLVRWEDERHVTTTIDGDGFQELHNTDFGNTQVSQPARGESPGHPDEKPPEGDSPSNQTADLAPGG